MYSQEHPRKLRGASCWPNAIRDVWGLVSRCYCTGNAGQATNRDNQNIQHPQEISEGTRKGPFHHKPHKLPHRCRRVFRPRGSGWTVRWNTGKQRSISAGTLFDWSNLAWLIQEEKSCPSMSPSKHDQTAKLNQWFYLLSLCCRRPRQSIESFSRGETLLLKGSMTLQSKRQGPNTCTAWRNQRGWKKVQDGKEESQNPELTFLTGQSPCRINFWGLFQDQTIFLEQNMNV